MSNCKPISAYLCPTPTMEVRPMQEGESFELSATESALFDCITNEHVGISGTDFEYYSQNYEKSTVDPLYNEPVKRSFDGPYKIKGYLSFPDHSPTPGMEGYSSSFDATAWFPRSEVERANMPAPSESDIIRVWNTPFFNTTFAVDGFDIPGSGLYFSITDVQEDGVLFDNPYFVGFNCTLRRITQQTPERKLINNL